LIDGMSKMCYNYINIFAYAFNQIIIFTAEIAAEGGSYD